MRTGAIVAGSALMGVGGAFLTLSILVLVAVARRATCPPALLKPYIKGQR